MNKVFLKSIFFLCLFAYVPVFEVDAQSKIEDAINNLLEGDIIEVYKNHRLQAIEMAQLMKRSDMTPEQLEEAKVAYNVSKADFDSWLDMVAEDMLDKKKRKVLIKNPELVSWKYKGTLESSAKQLNNFYNVGSYAGITSFSIADVMIALDVARQLIKLIKEFRSDFRDLQEDKIYEMFTEPLRFPNWEEIN